MCVFVQKCRSVVGCRRDVSHRRLAAATALKDRRRQFVNCSRFFKLSFQLATLLFFLLLLLITWNAVSPDLMTLLSCNGAFLSMAKKRLQRQLQKKALIASNGKGGLRIPHSEVSSVSFSSFSIRCQIASMNQQQLILAQ